MIKCACGDRNCKIMICLGNEELWFTDKEGGECLMYLDPNAIRDLVKALKKCLNGIVFEEKDN